MDVRDIEPGMKVEYETTLDEIIEGIVIEILSPTQVLIQNIPGTRQQFIAHPEWLTLVE